MDRAKKRELRILNDRVWNGEKDLFSVSTTLDSSLKKNTAFIKRLRSAVSTPALATFLQEIKTLSLHKYLSEIISACYEGLCKLKTPSDVDAGVEIISALHQRFGPAEFTGHLGWLLGKGLATPDKSFLKALPTEAREREEKDRMSRQRTLLRVVTELWLVNVLRTLDDIIRPDDVAKSPASGGGAGKQSDGKPPRGAPSVKGGGAEPFPLEVLKDLLGHDRDHTNLPLLVAFIKPFSWDVLGVRPQGGAAAAADGRRTMEDDGAAKAPSQSSPLADPAAASFLEPDLPFTSAELQARFKTILSQYFDHLKAHLIRDQKSIYQQGRRNAEAYVKSGEVFEDRQAGYEKQVKAQERFVAHAQVLADVLGSEMPNLRDADDPFGNTAGSIGLVNTGEYLKSMGDGAGIWEDEEERRFYENLVDLKGKVPAILLEDGKQQKKKKAEQDDQAGGGGKGTAHAEGTDAVEPADEQSLAISNKTIGAQVDALLVRLPNLITKDQIDQLAIDFCFLNSKASRNRLVKALTDVPKGRSDILAPWSRLVATLGRYMADVSKGVVEHLDSEFRSLQRRKEKEFLGQVRLSNIRYLAELTKFGVVPEHVIFHCLKVSLDDFSRTNIEIICNLLETCGRYLYRNPETAPRLNSFLETLQRKKSVQHIGQQERMSIENAIYYVDPPPRPAILQKERTPMELFVRKLVYVDLTKRNHGKILKQIRRLHWEEPEVVAILERVFSKPAKVKFGNVHVLAVLLGGLYRYQPRFVVRVIDNVLESICLDLEQNDFRFYQRRLAEARYLSELYNYRLLEHPVIFDTMYKIMTFGHGGAPPVPGRINPFDLADDFFRIRLVCTILDACGTYFERGAAGKKLESFLSFLQYYVFTKNPLPMEIDFMIHDTFSLVRPQWKLATSLEEASEAFRLSIAQNLKSAPPAADADESMSTASSEDENMDDDGGDADDDSFSDEDVAAADDRKTESHGLGEEDSGGSEEEDELEMSRPQEVVDPEEEADFEREFAKMMTESLESRKFDRKPLFDLALPVRSKSRDPATVTAPTSSIDRSSKPDGMMAFSLLTKKGNRQQTKTVELPSDSTFAVAMRHQQQAEREEQQRIKNLVLNYDLHDTDDDDEDGPDRQGVYPHPRLERARDRPSQKTKKLQLSDVDWT